MPHLLSSPRCLFMKCKRLSCMCEYMGTFICFNFVAAAVVLVTVVSGGIIIEQKKKWVRYLPICRFETITRKVRFSLLENCLLFVCLCEYVSFGAVSSVMPLKTNLKLSKIYDAHVLKLRKIFLSFTTFFDSFFFCFFMYTFTITPICRWHPLVLPFYCCRR